jgi:uncharacterized membrane protein
MEPGNSSNPYQAPSVDVMRPAETDAISFIPNGRSVGAGKAFGWIGAAWRLFVHAPLIWIVNSVIYFVIAMVLGLIPILGSFVSNFLYPSFTGGFLIGADRLRRGESYEVGHLFAGFQQKATPLLILGAIWIGAGLLLLALMGILFAVFVGTSGFLGAMMSGDEARMESLMASMGAGAIGGFILVMLVTMLAAIPLFMALWFAPALVVFHDMSPTAAIVSSFKASLKNIIPLVLCFITLVVMTLFAMIPFGLGLLVVFPIIFATQYTCYRDVFVGDDEQ